MLKTVFAATLLVAGLNAHAAYTLYTSEADYLAAVGPTLAYVDFAGSPAAVVAGNSFTPAVTFGSCPTGLASCGNQVFHNSDGITDLGGSPAPNGVAALGGLFTAPTLAFAFNFVSGDIASLGFDDGNTLDTTAAAAFIGVVSTTPVASFIAINAVFPGGIGNDRYFFDDFRINASIPEPASLALVACGGLSMLGVAALRRRRCGAA